MRREILSNLCDIFIGRTPSRNVPSYWGEGNKWVSIRDMRQKYLFDTKEEITDEGVRASNIRLVKAGTLLFSFKLTIGKMAFANCDLYTNEAIAAFEIKDSKELSADYLYFALRSVNFLGKNQAVMGQTLNLKSLGEITVPLPHLDDQRRIAFLLGKVESLIAERKTHLQQLDDLLKSVFMSMFGDPVRNERGWTKKPLAKLCANVIDCPHSTPEYSETPTGFYCVRSSDIVEGYIDLTNTLQVSEETFIDRIRRHTPTVDNIVYSREGGRLGNAARILTDDPICLGQRIMLFEVNVENTPGFVWSVLESAPFKRVIQGLVGGGAAPRVNVKDLVKIEVIAPPKPIQDEYAAVVKLVDSLKAQYQVSLLELENLYGVLSQRAFKGELDLTRVPLDAAPSVVVPVKEQMPVPFEEGLLDVLGIAADLNAFHVGISVLQPLLVGLQFSSAQLNVVNTLLGVSSPLEELQVLPHVVTALKGDPNTQEVPELAAALASAQAALSKAQGRVVAALPEVEGSFQAMLGGFRAAMQQNPLFFAGEGKEEPTESPLPIETFEEEEEVEEEIDSEPELVSPEVAEAQVQLRLLVGGSLDADELLAYLDPEKKQYETFKNAVFDLLERDIVTQVFNPEKKRMVLRLQ